MTSVTLAAFVGYIGILSELGGALILVALFALLRRYAARRPFFPVWGWGWLALTISITALAIRYFGLVVTEHWKDEFSLLVRSLYAIYQVDKLLFYGFITVGVAMYTRGIRAGRVLPRMILGLGLYGALTAGFSGGLSQMLQFNTPVALACFGSSAWMLLRLPPSRRSVGSRAAGVALAILSLLWITYFLSFALRQPLLLTPLARPLAFILAYNSYFDLLLHMLLGYGMILLLMEDQKREADDAHAVLAAVHDKLRREALYDPLTGVLNRRAFAEGIGLEWANSTYGAVVMVDVDGLKPVNDRHGHPAGDELLRRTADILRGALRASDRLYRWGGDEFLLLMPSARSEDVVERLRTAMSEAPPIPVAHASPIRLSVSIGAADFIGAESLTAAVERADRAMYQDKQGPERARRLTPPDQVA